jgi:manganese-dependent inorganic pyrophosphatase
MPIYVVGHKNPDTDSVVSAVALADFLGGDYLPAKAGELNNETEYILNRFNIEIPKTLPESAHSVVLVDHNSPEEALECITPERIKAVYDHHKLCGVFTDEAVLVRMQPVGSTSTIMAKMYQEEGKKPSKSIASALLCGVLSDTLKFNSPTTTEIDKEMAEFLNEIADIDIETTAQAMFMAKSDISGIKTEDLLTKDYKVFEMSGQKVGIGVWETVLPDAVMARKSEIIDALKKEKEKSKLDYAYFAIIDIVSEVAHFIIEGDKEKEVAEAVFKGTVRGDVLVAEGVVSRKKQIIPPLEKYFA